MGRISRVIHCVFIASVLTWGAQTWAQAPNTTTVIARLSGASQVPPNPSNASGSMQATLDKQRRVLTWTLTTHDLSGPVTGANFHGPAMPGEKGAVAVPLTVGQNLDAGVVTLSSAQVEDLLAGRWYVNVFTAASPEGEIRGQVMIGR